MAASLGKMPIFMRIGDGPEYEMGTIEPDASDMFIAPDGTATVQVRLAAPRVLRQIAAMIEGADNEPGLAPKRM
jgi:hypothetical protein